MFCPIIATSTDADVFKAAKEVASAAKVADLKAVFAYCSCDYDVKALISAIGDELGAPVFGNTSFTGVITNEGYFGGDKPPLSKKTDAALQEARRSLPHARRLQAKTVRLTTSIWPHRLQKKSST